MAFVSICVLFTNSCTLFFSEVEKKQPLWINNLNQEVTRLGAKNWIVVSDAAYAMPNDLNVRTVMVDTDIDEALEMLFQQMESLGHVWARSYKLREFDHLNEELAPGVNGLKTRLNKVLSYRKTQQISFKTAEALLQTAAQDYQVLVIKTNTAYPYSSVYLELDSGYWTAESEQSLREKMSE